MADSNSSAIVPASVLIAALGIGGTYLAETQLQSSRHIETPVTPIVAMAYEETLEARLWQDPLEVVNKDWERSLNKLYDTDEPQQFPANAIEPSEPQQLSDRITANHDADCPLLVMPVWVESGWYANQRETRRRQRYALVTAATVQHFVPSEPHKIGFMLANNQNAHAEPLNKVLGTSTSLYKSHSPIPYEWYEPSNNQLNCDHGWRNILVLWLSTDFLRSAPLNRTSALIESLLPKGLIPNDQIAISIIGPANSSQLKQLAAVKSSNQDQALVLQPLPAPRIEAIPEAPIPITTPEAKPAPIIYNPDPASYAHTASAASLGLDLVNVLEVFAQDLAPRKLGEIGVCATKAVKAFQEGNNQTPIKATVGKDCLPLNKTGLSQPVTDDILNFWASDNGILSNAQKEILASLSQKAQSMLYLANSLADKGLPLNATLKGFDNCLQDNDSSLASCYEGLINANTDQQKQWAIKTANTWLKLNPKANTSQEIDLQLAEQLIAAATLPTPSVKAPLQDTEQTQPAQTQASEQSSVKLHPLRDNASYTLYSARATLPWSFINDCVGLDDSGRNCDEIFENHVQQNGYPNFEFKNGIENDIATIKLLVDELKARNVIDHNKRKPQVAALFELESAYGRALPIILDCLLAEPQLATRSTRLEHSISECKREREAQFKQGFIGVSNTQYIHEFGYLSGIDGEQASHSYSENSEKADSTTEKSLTAETTRASAVGNTQYDYLRRLSRRIQEDYPEIRAIAVFGSDHYDKQLIIQALKRQMPNKLFLTTDFDDRYTHPSQLNWNQNLLVGSAYGLKIELKKPASNQHYYDQFLSSSLVINAIDEWDRAEVDTAPFRDSYQTALFKSVSEAISQQTPSLPKPRLFEIGHDKAFDITPFAYKIGSLKARKDYQVRHVGWKVELEDNLQLLLDRIIVFSPLLLSISIWLFRYKRLNAEDELERASLINASMGLILVTGFLFLLSGLSIKNHLEPQIYLQGISSLPTFFIRLEVIVIGIAVTYIASRRFAQNSLTLERRYGLAIPKITQSHNKKSLLKHGLGLVLGTAQAFVRLFKTLRFALSQPKVFFSKLYFFHQNANLDQWQRDIESSAAASTSSAAQDLWQVYQNYSGIRYRLWRALPIAAMLISLIAFWYTTQSGNIALSRAEDLLTPSIAGAINYLTILVICITIALTMDALKLGQTFIFGLGRIKVVFPEIDTGRDKSSGYDPAVWSATRKIELIAHRTEAILPLVLFPCAMICLLMISRSRFFDGWPFNYELQAIYLGLLLLVVLRSLALQKNAELARIRIIRQLERKRDRLLGKEPVPEHKVQQIDNTIEYIRHIRRGAFKPWLQHPIVQGLLLPFGGAGSLALIEAFF